jgi:hypothetical protein
VPVWVRFDWCTPMEIPSCWPKRSPSKGRSSRGRQWEGRVTSPSSLSSSSYLMPPPKDSGSEGDFSPRALAAARAALQAHLYLCSRSHSLWIWLASRLTASSGWGDPPWGAARVPKILHKNVYALRSRN